MFKTAFAETLCGAEPLGLTFIPLAILSHRVEKRNHLNFMSFQN